MVKNKKRITGLEISIKVISDDIKNIQRIKKKIANYKEKYIEVIEKIKEDEEKMKHLKEGENNYKKELSNAKDDFQKSKERLKNAINQYKIDLPKLEPIVEAYYGKIDNKYITEILDIISELKTMTGAEDYEWEDKICRLGVGLADLRDLLNKFDNSNNNEDLYRLVQKFEENLNEYEEAKEDMNKKDAKLLEASKNVNNSEIKIKKLQAEMNKDIEDEKELKELSDEKQYRLKAAEGEADYILVREKFESA